MFMLTSTDNTDSPGLQITPDNKLGIAAND